MKNSETLLRSLEFVIHLEHDVITVSNLVENWSTSTQISYSCRDVAIGVVQICSNECWVRVIWINDKNNNVYKTKRKETIHMLSSTISNLKSAKPYRSRRILVSRKNSLFWHQHVISIFFSYTMYYNFHCELPHCTFHVSLSFLLLALESIYCSFKRFILVS